MGQEFEATNPWFVILYSSYRVKWLARTSLATGEKDAHSLTEPVLKDAIPLLLFCHRGKMWDDYGGMAYKGEICKRKSLGVVGVSWRTHCPKMLSIRCIRTWTNSTKYPLILWLKRVITTGNICHKVCSSLYSSYKWTKMVTLFCFQNVKVLYLTPPGNSVLELASIKVNIAPF